jgi:hypothetical protein
MRLRLSAVWALMAAFPEPLDVPGGFEGARLGVGGWRGLWWPGPGGFNARGSVALPEVLKSPYVHLTCSAPHQPAAHL